MDESKPAPEFVSPGVQASAVRSEQLLELRAAEESIPGVTKLREPGWREYLRRAAARDETALAALYDETCSLVYSLAFRILSDPANAEEVTLDVYAQVWRSAGSFDAARGSVVSWLATLTRSRSIDRLRQLVNRRREEAIEEAREVAAVSADPEEEVSLRQQRKRVHAALDTLPLEQRQVIEMGYFGALSHGEIAARLRIPLGTVKTRVRLGMTKLRMALS